MKNDLIVQPNALPTRPIDSTPHILGAVVDDWHAIEVWLATVASNSRNGKTSTVATYRFHLAKLRWFCEKVLGRPPSTWSMQDVEAFRDFLKEVPPRYLPANKGEPNHTPFKSQPSVSSQSDIMRFTKAMFGALQASGYLQRDPMAMTKAPAARRLNVSRAIHLDVYDTVLHVMDEQDRSCLTDRRRHLRDRFILVCLREAGLRATEIVGAKMGAFTQLADPANRKTYWVFTVSGENAKGGKERPVPVTSLLMDALIAYRLSFALPPYPSHGDSTPLLLSPRTKKIELKGGAITRAADKRFFGAWASVTTRQGLNKIIKARLSDAAAVIQSRGDRATADRLREASAHWLRHTFATAALLKGQDIRTVASMLGHSSVETTMNYTRQGALDVVRASEKVDFGAIAQVQSPAIFDDIESVPK
jgi:site-specific recombinase XerD